MLQLMARISAQSVAELWDRLAELEHSTGHELALRVGIGPSTVTGWRKGRATTVHPSLFGLIEARLGYRCTLKSNGKWDIQKIGAAPSVPEVSVFHKKDETVSEEMARAFSVELATRLEGLDLTDAEAIVAAVGAAAAAYKNKRKQM